jgi:hypothetical protein
MSDLGDDFRAWKEHRQERRRENLRNSTAILEREGIPFTSHNNGVHLIVLNKWNFYPSTGLFIDRETGEQGRGVFNLLRLARRSAI